MSCRRSFDIDLAAFLLAPSDAAWDEFRAHYPLCADCSAEVAAWTALHESLAPAHPAEETLLRWSDDPTSLDAASRAAVERHLEQCRSCRDELRALAGFAAVVSGAEAVSAASAVKLRVRPAAPAAAEASIKRGPSAQRDGRRSEGSTRARPPQPRREPFRRVRRILWHPALAYAALLVVLLLPTFRARFDEDAGRRAFAPEPQAAAPESAAVPVTRKAPAPQLEERPQQAPAEQPRRDRIAVDQPPAQSAGAGDERARPLAALGKEAPSSDARTEPELRDRVAPGSPAKRAQQAVAAPAPPPPAAAAARGAVEKDDARAMGGLAEMATAQNLQPKAKNEAATGPAIALDPASSSATRRLTVALPAAASDETLEVRVREANGARELREMAHSSSGAREVTIGIPRVWLVAGDYLVEVYANGALVARGSVAAR